MPNLDVNFLAVIAAAAAHQALGFLWYGPLFGSMWLRGMGKTREELGAATQAIAISVVSSLVTALALAVLLTVVDELDVAVGMGFGAIAGVGFVATSIATGAAFEGRSPVVTLLFVVYQVIGFIVMGAILGAWR